MQIKDVTEIQRTIDCGLKLKPYKPKFSLYTEYLGHLLHLKNMTVQ